MFLVDAEVVLLALTNQEVPLELTGICIPGAGRGGNTGKMGGNLPTLG